eukprot:4960680-Pleurochrysis_carterae.AAC.3
MLLVCVTASRRTDSISIGQAFLPCCPCERMHRWTASAVETHKRPLIATRHCLPYCGRRPSRTCAQHTTMDTSSHARTRADAREDNRIAQRTIRYFNAQAQAPVAEDVQDMIIPPLKKRKSDVTFHLHKWHAQPAVLLALCAWHQQIFSMSTFTVDNTQRVIDTQCNKTYKPRTVAAAPPLTFQRSMASPIAKLSSRARP